MFKGGNLGQKPTLRMIEVFRTCSARCEFVSPGSLFTASAKGVSSAIRLTVVTPQPVSPCQVSLRILWPFPLLPTMAVQMTMAVQIILSSEFRANITAARTLRRRRVNIADVPYDEDGPSSSRTQVFCLPSPVPRDFLATFSAQE